MTKEKQIDEMAKLICTYPQCIHYNIIGECKISECQTVDIAEALYNAGYRKASEVAAEIFAEIETILYRAVYPSIHTKGKVISTPLRGWHLTEEEYQTIKKKYTEDNHNDSRTN